MRRSKAELYFHFVWATHQRHPFLVPEIEAKAYACLVKEVDRQGCEVLVIGGMPDHVHLAVKASTLIAPARLAQQLKGTSSTYLRKDQLADGVFGWQEGYGVFSLSRSHKDRIIHYIRDQKRHHASGELWPEWEETYEDV